MTAVAVIQARTGSSRLPAKAMLPVGGVPLAVLAAQRAANRGRKVVVATSEEDGDDALAALLERHGIEVHRGSLKDVLGRYVDALAGYSDNTPIIRLTADNVVSDGFLLEILEEEFNARELDYLSCSSTDSGLPYGVSAEITLVGHLREAARATTLQSDREHVTPWIIRKYGAASLEKLRSISMGHYRCTVDNLDDYLTIQRLFSGVSNPVEISALELCEKLRDDVGQPLTDRPVPRLIPGTAQLGLAYGIVNRAGRPPLHRAVEILHAAIRNGVVHVDTARAYGESEKVVGHALQNGWQGRIKVITKLSPLDACPSDASPDVVRAFVDASVFESCTTLGVARIDVLLLHRAAHLRAWNGAVWRRLIELRDEDRIGALGISVQNPSELAYAIDEPATALIQLPFNLLDGRWDEAIRHIMAVRAERGLIVHARSALLQGLLTSDDVSHWQRAGLPDPHAVLTWLNCCTAEFGRRNVADLCMAYVNSQSWIDGVVAGMESIEQLTENIICFAEEPLKPSQVEQLRRDRPLVPEVLLDPARWGEVS